ncbi:MAG: C40 family peptidase, partial [Clostridia bacterium]|nr:C40 family peptidase [Clostridia bacterium]
KREALLVGTESLEFVATRGKNPSLLKEPAAGSDRIYPFRSSDAVVQYEWIVLDRIEGKSDTFLHVRAVGADAEGYLSSRYAQPSMLSAPESTYAMMVRPRGLIYCGRTQDATIVAHADYEVVRVFGVTDAYACVVNAEGKTGYAELGQIQFIDRETFDAYLHQSCETPESTFDRDELPEIGEAYIDQPYQNSAEFVYALLTATGLHFNEGYYRYYQKPLDQEKLYPHGLYRDNVYNTLLYKLFNSSGQHVTSNGQETEWAYIDSFDDIEPGDLLFFSDTSGKGDPVIQDVEVVIHGKYSGDVTDCGIYLGENLMLTVRRGVVAEIEIDQIMQYNFDCARRIYPHVYDERAHFIENMITMIYDRLGTPYSNGKRVGDASYDCSGIINWVLRAYDYDRYRNPSLIPIEITATAFGHLEAIYSPDNTITFKDTGIHSRENEDLAKLERGDIVLLLNERRNKIGHVMIYLGNNTVIHSTTISGRYRGTLVARFRNHLHSLYSSSQRIDQIIPNN